MPTKTKPEGKPEPAPAVVPAQPAQAKPDVPGLVLRELLGDIALNEDRVGRIARRILRAKRDGTKLSDTEIAEAKALAATLGKAYEQAQKTDAFTPDGHGNDMFSVDWPPELQDEPAELVRATPNAASI